MIMRRRMPTLLWIIVVLLLIAGATTFFIAQSRPAVIIPQAVIDKTLFPIYVPQQLPAGFTLAEQSIANSDGVVVFELKNSAGRVIAVSEQAMPADFNLTEFYEKQMKGARTISGAPFHSVLGEMIVENGQGDKFLSVRADATWVIVTGKAIRDDELELIARQLKRL